MGTCRICETKTDELYNGICLSCLTNIYMEYEKMQKKLVAKYFITNTEIDDGMRLILGKEKGNGIQEVKGKRD